MERLKLFKTSLLTGLLLMGCLSAPELYPPDQAPAYVREIKYIRLFGHEAKKDTGIDLSEGEPFSVMATGTVYLHRNHSGISPGSWNFVQYIGDQSLGTALWPLPGATLSSPHAGRLNVGILDSLHQDNHGYFDVTIIVWRDENYSQISDFLNAMLAKNPEHLGIKLARDQARRLNEIFSAKAETSQAIEATKKQLAEIQHEDQRKTGSAAAAGDRRARELEKRLSELTAKMAELDELSRQLQQARRTTADLARQLEDLERRERELIGKADKPAASLPIILISSPEDNERIVTGNIQLSGAAEDGKGLQRLDIYLNGDLIPSAERGAWGSTESDHPKRLTFDRRLDLKSGPNQIRVIATSLTGLAAEKLIKAHYTPRSRNVWAVVVGINDYPRLPKLKYAVNDAQAFFDLLTAQNHVPAANITLLVNNQATLRNLRSALGVRLKEAVDKDDMVIIYFAGHGAVEPDTKSLDADGLEKYLLAYDSDPAELYASGFPMREIAHILDRIRSERLIFLADSCYSGASGGRTITISGMRANIADTFLERIVAGRGKVIITASAANEVSVEKDELQHGVFTYYLLEGLRGAADTDQDGMITVDEAYRYVTDKVPRATGQEQHPVKKGTVEGNLVLSISRQ
jgi:uncharacterized caspase-like protein